MQQKWIVSILIALVIALIAFNVGKLSKDSTTGFSISSNTVTLTISPEKVPKGAKVFFEVEPNGGKYYTAVDVYRETTTGLDDWIANIDMNTDYGSCRLCDKKGTGYLLTSSLQPGKYYAQVLPVGSKSPVTAGFSII